MAVVQEAWLDADMGFDKFAGFNAIFPRKTLDVFAGFSRISNQIRSQDKQVFHQLDASLIIDRQEILGVIDVREVMNENAILQARNAPDIVERLNRKIAVVSGVNVKILPAGIFRHPIDQ